MSSTESGSAPRAIIVPPEEIILDFYEVVPPLGYAVITRNQRTGRLMYRVVEPVLTREDQAVIEELKRILVEEQRPSLEELRKRGAEEVLRERVERIIKRYRLPIPREAFDKVFYYVRRDMLGYGKIDLLIRDPQIEDISCDGIGLPVFVWHSRFESLPTNIVFADASEMESVLVRLALKAGKQISVAQPIVEGSLPEGFRLHAALSEVARRGGTFTVRKFREVPFSVVDLVVSGTLSPELAAFLWLLVEHKKSLIVVGATAGGKTTLLNAIATFIRPEAKIVSIEETPELNLPHENWVPLVARPASDPWARDVTLFDLLKSALRMRPDYVIVGEVRGEEAFTLFQAIATGHAGMCTMHAENADYAVKRLTSEPMNVPVPLIPLMNVFVTVRRFVTEDKIFRRVVEVSEILAGDKLAWNPVYRYDQVSDKIMRVGESTVLARIAEEEGVPLSLLVEELKRREEIIKWLVERKITDFQRVSRLVRDYALRPTTVYTAIERGVYTL
ncbi:type II/IV secretion system ATPase subunit [Infirmifilum sp.]|uniref:type II/IV secretion system ATPase subunit n=1 Tax=Infirmifilum sp. TaxID=2856575 RepID=UPI003D0A1098